jgi:hypothetical protein
MKEELGKPKCVLCKKVMTPENAKIHPEYFYCDGCLPDDLRPKARPEAKVKHEMGVAATALGVSLQCSCGWDRNLLAGASMEALREIEATHMLEHEREL